MTALILLDNYELSDYITSKYPDDYENKGKVAYIPENIEINIENLLKLLLVYSANDAAYISALAVSDTVDDFLILMNDKAKKLNMDNTNYSNPDGIDDINHYTTLNDLLKLSIEISENIELLSIISKTKFVYEISGVEKTYKSTNLIINEGFTGLKTGWTDLAGLTFIGLNQSNYREIITIVNKSLVDDKKITHFNDTKTLYEASIESFKNINIINRNENLYVIRNSRNTTYQKPSEEWSVFTNLDKNNILVFNKYENNKLYFTYEKNENSYKTYTSKNKIKWLFNPLKILQRNANQK
tara:strand:- start:434 stop:1327 length:894 start_codon:yes stop_codon:yes gene_type:complete